MEHALDLGSTTFGILIDGYEDTEHLPCLLSVGDFGRLIIQVSFPYLEPFNLSTEGAFLWVNKQPIPKRMTFRHAEGEVELFGTRFIGSTTPLGNGKTARISCEISLAVEGPVSIGGDEPSFVSLRQSFYNPRAIKPINMHRFEFDNSSTLPSDERVIRIPESKELWRWSFDGFDHVISEVHRTIQEPGSTKILTRVEFESSHSDSKFFKELSEEQQKFANLMQIVNSKQVPLIDPSVLLDGAERSFYKRLRSGKVRTSLIRESAEREGEPCIQPSQMEAEHLVKWYDSYPTYLRAISALSSLLPRIDIDSEERMINSFIALETIAHISLGYSFGERGKESASDFVVECLKILGIQQLEFASNLGAFSEALALNYNGIKHPKTSAFPDALDTAFFGIIAQGIARAALIKQTLGIQVDFKAMPEITWAEAVARQENIKFDQ